jgi:hypothetical protein
LTQFIFLNPFVIEFFFQFHPPTTQSSSFLFIFSSISSFNIRLFENWASWFFFQLLYMKLSWSHDFNFFTQFQFLIVDVLEIEFYIIFYFLFMRSSYSHDPFHELNKLARVDLSYFFIFIFILSFNIGLVENWVSWFFFSMEFS